MMSTNSITVSGSMFKRTSRTLSTRSRRRRQDRCSWLGWLKSQKCRYLKTAWTREIARCSQETLLPHPKEIQIQILKQVKIFKRKTKLSILATSQQPKYKLSSCSSSSLRRPPKSTKRSTLKLRELLSSQLLKIQKPSMRPRLTQRAQLPLREELNS